MDYRSRFNDSEWRALLMMPLWIAAIVRDVKVDAVEPDKVATELMRIVNEERDSFELQFTRSILDALSQGMSMMTYQPDPRNATEGFQAVADIIARKLPDTDIKLFTEDMVGIAFTLETSLKPSENHIKEFLNDLAYMSQVLQRAMI